MKSYLKFLSRNKLYTAIEAVGLVVSLAFVVIIACYTWQQFAVTREAQDYKRLYSLNMGREGLQAYPGAMSIVQDRVPDVEAAGRIDHFATLVRYNGHRLSEYPFICSIDPIVFDILPQSFLSGSKEVLNDRNQVLLGETFAKKISPDMDPVGQVIVIGRDTCIIGGIIQSNDRTILKECDIYKAFSEPDSPTSLQFIIPVDCVLLRFREGAEHEAVRALIDTVMTHEFESTYANRKPNYRMTLPFRELYFSPRNQLSNTFKSGNQSLLYVLIAVGILLLVSALFNYINLSVALAGKRAKEMAIRTALGEPRDRIVKRYIVEAVLFVAVCMMLAVLLAHVFEPVFNKYVAGDIGLQIAYSPAYILAYLILALIVGLISGLIPSGIIFKFNPVDIIKGEQRRQTKTVFSKVFIVVQNIITVALISLALVMELQYKHLVNMPLGVDVSGLYYMSASNAGIDKLAAKPYVDKIGVTHSFPGRGNMSMSTMVDGQDIDIGIIQCNKDAFDIFGFEIVNDFHTPSGNGIWLTESAAKVFSVDDHNPILPQVFLSFMSNQPFAGIIKDYVAAGPTELAGNQVNAVSVSSDDYSQAILGMETTGIVLKLNRQDKEVRSELQEIGREESLKSTGDIQDADSYGFIPELIEKDMDKTRNFISLIELFMFLAAILSLLGLVAMSAYYASLQTRDIAVRKVFGGTIRTETLRSVKEYMILVGIAILVGIPVSIYFADRYLQQFYYKIEGYWWVFVVAAVIALAISFLAVLFQTLKAAKTNTAIELKKE